jgi:hypothetical protein
MLRKSLAVVVSSAWLLTSTAAIAASATEAAKTPPVPAGQSSTSTKNEPPLPPAGPVDIKNAQGQFSDWGIGAILVTYLAAGGLLAWIFFSIDDDDDDDGPTGTFP